MKKGKLESLKLHVSIHTICLHSYDIPEKLYLYKDAVKCKKNDEYYNLIINPSKIKGERLQSLSEYQSVISHLLEDMNIKNYDLMRADFCLDSFDQNYEEFYKLNKLLLAGISLCGSMKNCYKSKDLWSLERLTLRIQDDYREAEYYNKELESLGKDIARARLELRSKKLKSRQKRDIRTIVDIDWLKRLDKLENQYNSVLDKYNRKLSARWQKEKGINVKSVQEFVRKHESSIFSASQLAEFYKMIGIDNAQRKAYKFKEQNSVEYISKNEFKAYMKSIKGLLQEFLSN